MTAPVKRRTTAAYHVQAVLSFVISVLAMGVGIAYLSAGAWVRAFLGLGLLYVVTSAFTLAKVIRDRQDEDQVVSRVDQARLDKLLAEHDPFRVDMP